MWNFSKKLWYEVEKEYLSECQHLFWLDDVSNKGVSSPLPTSAPSKSKVLYLSLMPLKLV